MAFPDGWGRRAKMTVQSSQIFGTHTNFPALILAEQLPAEINNSGGSYPALEGGGDIRFSLDKDGQQQLALDIKSFHLDNHPQYPNSAQLFVKFPSGISDVADKDCYVWWNKAEESQPAVTNEFGRNAVWEDVYISCWHLNEASGTTAVDAAGRHDGTYHGTLPDKVWSGLGQGQRFDGDGTSADYISIPDHADFNQYQDTSIELIAKSNDSGGEYRGAYTKDREQFSAHTVGIWRNSAASGEVHFRVGQYTHDDTVWPTSGFQYLHLKWAENGGVAKGWINGVENWSGVTASGEPANGTNPIYLGRSFDGGSSEWFDGIITEARWAQGLLSDNWIKTQYSNYTDNPSFWVTGSPETPDDLPKFSEKAMHRGIHKGIHRGIS